MLRLSIHAVALDTASRFNLLAWLDIGYDKLEPIADYKTMLYQAGVGAMLPAPIYNYPRWSASLWNLTARALALGLREDPENITEEVPPFVATDKRFAFADQMCALIEHLPTAGNRHRRTLSSAEIKQVGRKRGHYVATFDEHTMKLRVTAPFMFRPAHLQAAELVLHACLIHLNGKPEMPPRPALCVPPPLKLNGQRFVQIHQLVEPARTGFVTWLYHNDAAPLEHKTAPLGVAPESLYVRFLKEAQDAARQLRPVRAFQQGL
jgi:hypothetical protein